MHCIQDMINGRDQIFNFPIFLQISQRDSFCSVCHIANNLNIAAFLMTLVFLKNATINVSLASETAVALHYNMIYPHGLSTHRGWVTNTCVSYTMPSLVQIKYLVGANPLSEPMLPYCLLDPWELTCNFNRNSNFFIQEQNLKMSSAKWRPFYFGLKRINQPFLIQIAHIFAD